MTTAVADSNHVSITVSDTCGQRTDTFRVSRGLTVAKLVSDLKRSLHIDDEVPVKALVERMGTLLNGEEIVRDVVQEGDKLVLFPEVSAATVGGRMSHARA